MLSDYTTALYDAYIKSKTPLLHTQRTWLIYTQRFDAIYTPLIHTDDKYVYKEQQWQAQDKVY